VSISCDEYREDLHRSVDIYNGWSSLFLLIITLFLIAALLWIFLMERRIQRI
jgi:hypothetical protein